MGFFNHNNQFSMNVMKTICGDLKEADDHMVSMAQKSVKERLAETLLYLEDTFGLEMQNDKNVFTQFLEKENIGTTFDIIRKFITMLLMTAFFVVLWLAESINVHDVLDKIILKGRYASIRAFRKIERDLITFIKVKVLVSFLTGVGTGVACYFFDVSFPIFWGIFAFFINFLKSVIVPNSG